MYCCWLVACIVVVVLCVLLLVGRLYCCSCLMCICCTVCALLVFSTLDAGLLASSQYSEGPATGHLDTGFSRFPCAYKQTLRRFLTFPVATTRFSCSPPDLNLAVTDFMFCQMKHQLDATLCRFYLCRVTLHVSGVKRPSSGVFKTSTAATGTCVIVAGKSSHHK